jgi:hypothetical protein
VRREECHINLFMGGIDLGTNHEGEKNKTRARNGLRIKNQFEDQIKAKTQKL